MVKRQILPQNALRHDNSCVVNYGAKLNIALTCVRSRVREVLANDLSYTFNSIPFTESCLFFCKKCFPAIYKINTQNYDTFETLGTYL